MEELIEKILRDYCEVSLEYVKSIHIDGVKRILRKAIPIIQEAEREQLRYNPDYLKFRDGVYVGRRLQRQLERQKRLESPELRDIEEIITRPVLRKECKCEVFSWGWNATCPTCTAGKILALFPDIEEAKKQERIAVGLELKQLVAPWGSDLVTIPYQWIEDLAEGQVIKRGE